MDNVVWIAILSCIATVAASGLTAWAAMRVQVKRFEEAEKDRTQNESKKNNADAAVAAMGAATSAANLNKELSDRIRELSDKHENAVNYFNTKLDDYRKAADAERSEMLGKINHLSGENSTLRSELETRNMEHQVVINELNAWRTRYDNIISRIAQLAEEINRLEKRARSYEAWAKANVDKVRSLGGEPVPFVEINIGPGVKL